MIKNIKKTDFLFFIILSLVLLVHIFFAFLHPSLYDESYYATIPLRLLNGDSLVQNEWNLTQFSSLFTYLPVYIWTAIKGSTEGIIIFLRFLYLALHTAITVVIYRFFKQYGKWAIMASLIFFVQMPYRLIAISYQSVFVICLILFSFCLIKIYQKNITRFYIFAGICFGCCCVCNPLFCFAYILYLLACVLWAKREIIKKNIINIQNSRAKKKDEKLTKKQKAQQEQQFTEKFPDIESYTCFFNKGAILRFACGILIVAIIAIIFFFATGGTIDSILNNIENILISSEYDIVSKSHISKLQETIQHFSSANLGMPWLLPLIFILLLSDKKRKLNTHRLFYLVVSLLWAIMFGLVILIKLYMPLCAVSLPFFVISTMCYILTEKKNKVLFYCMYVPCLIATFFQYIASNTHLAAIGIVLAAANVAGVIFAMDFCKEIRFDTESNTQATTNKKVSNLFRNIIIVSFCFQIFSYGAFSALYQIPESSNFKATSGPFKGLYMTEQQYNNYNKAINDIDYIKEITEEDDPVLIASLNNWWYLHIDRPFATYTAWYQRGFNRPLLEAYYQANPEKFPKYIYIEESVEDSSLLGITRNMARDMFNVTNEEELSNGILLTIN